MLSMAKCIITGATVKIVEDYMICPVCGNTETTKQFMGRRTALSISIASKTGNAPLLINLIFIYPAKSHHLQIRNNSQAVISAFRKRKSRTT